ncbi:MAG TPA: SRPBCC domain-containing protein [Actinospica sp.]|jgi:uncharacterized protein YndB with AHSA1/START domain|nr:SRPBCC domain-containing protein [Actinospica sp.]
MTERIHTQPVLRFEQYIAQPPAAVWRALTDPGLHAKWWVAGDIGAEAGRHFTLEMGEWGKQRCEVTAVEPERLFAYRFGTGSLDTVITWLMEPEGEGTLLHFEQAGFDLDSPMGRQAYAGMGNGWPRLLGRIERAITDSGG